MKTKKTKKLTLNRETVQQLNREELNRVLGGGGGTLNKPLNQSNLSLACA